jgi:MOSC domain-containing protein YiiM
MEQGRILAVCISERKGERKKEIGLGLLIKNFGLQGDAHAGDWHRQISLLGDESIDKMRRLGLKVGVGDFAENLTIIGINLPALPIGTRLRVGATALLEVTQIGKECHQHCAIYEQAGDCVMPREGIFARVLCGGPVGRDDAVIVVAAEA